MALSCWEEEEEDDYEGLGEQFDEDMNALKRACELAGENYTEIAQEKEEQEEEEEDEDDVDDTRFLQGIQNTLMLGSTQVLIPLMKTELEEKPLESYSEEDDADILRAIRSRFAGAASLLGSQTPLTSGSHFDESEACRTNSCEDGSRTSISMKHELCNNDAGSRLLDQVLQEDYAVSRAIFLSETPDDISVGKLSNGCIDADSSGLISSSIPKYSGIPGYARALINALKKNRLCKKTLRNKLMQIEKNMEENKELRNRVKCLVDFQNACKRRLRQLLAQDTDSTVKLISCSKTRFSSNKSKEPADIKVTYRCSGPPENEDVAKYKMVQKSFPTIVDSKRWSKKERENLGNGLKQQVQEVLVLQAMELLSSQENMEDTSLLDEQISSISQTEVTAENIRSFLPHVDWERVASTYVAAHSGADCESRWLNNEDPLINCSPWTKDEEKKLLLIVQNNGLHNWVQISNLLGTNRTPSQCLSRYQRSLNAHIMKKDWTEEEDEQLRAVVETFGENDWQIIAANMEGRTGAQCLNRWCKSILPDRKKVGRWTVEEDKLLKVAVVVYGPRMWKKIAAFVPGRTEVQCRERWCNVLDPSIKLEGWTQEEDAKLETAVSIYGYCWSKVAIFVPPRTDNQCRRRWKVLHPQELAAAQKARKIQKAALISNFVGRKKERPTIGPGDFVAEHKEGSCPEANEEVSSAPLIKKRRRHQHGKDNIIEPSENILGPDNLDDGHSYSVGMYTATENEELHSCPKTDRRPKRKRKKSTTPKVATTKIYDGGRNGLQTSSFNSNGELQRVLDAPIQTEELPLIVGDEVGKVCLQGNSKAKKVTGKQKKSWRKILSVYQNLDGPDLVQNTIPIRPNSESMFNADSEIAQSQVSSVKSCKSKKVKQTNSCRTHTASGWEKDVHETMQLAIPSVHDGECHQHVRATSSGHSTGVVLDKQGDQGLETPLCSIKSNKRAKEKRANSSRTASNKLMQGDRPAYLVGNVEQKTHEGTMQVMVPIATEHGNLRTRDHHVESHLELTKSIMVVKGKQSKPVNKGLYKLIHEVDKQTVITCSDGSNQESDNLRKLEVMMPTTTEEDNLDGMPISVDCERCFPLNNTLDTRMVMDPIHSASKTIQTGKNEDLETQFVMQCPVYILDIPSGESNIGQDETTAMATKTITLWPSDSALQDVSRNKCKETTDHVDISENRDNNGDKLRDDLVYTHQQKDIERVAHSQSQNPKLLLSNELSIPEQDTVSHALADQEMSIKGIINDRAEQTDDMRLRRSRRATRLDINYKELLNGNISFQTKRK